MSKFAHPTVRFFYPIIGCVILALSGCNTTDILTYSRDAQHEGERQYKDGNYADAAGAFRNSARQNPQNYEAYYWLGASYEKLGQYEQSIPAYKTAWQTIGLTAPGMYDEAFRYKILNGLASAIAKCDQRNIETDSAQKQAEAHGTSDAWYVLAKVYTIRGDADSAFDAFNRAVLLAPNNAYVNREYGLYMEKVGQVDKAAGPLRKAYAANNQDTEVAEALRRIGVIPGPSLREQGQLAEPLVPKGPIPELQAPKGSRPSVQAPRD